MVGVFAEVLENPSQMMYHWVVGRRRCMRPRLVCPRTMSGEVSMDRLWAPWRMQYIKEAGKDEGCFLCRAAASQDDRASYVVCRTKAGLVVLNRWPYNNGHLLVAPLTHKAGLEELTDEELSAQMDLLKRSVLVLKGAMSAEGFNVGLNLGRAAGAGVPGHMHWHIVPRWVGDTNFMPVLSDTKIIVQSLDAVWELLHKAYAEA